MTPPSAQILKQQKGGLSPVHHSSIETTNSLQNESTQVDFGFQNGVSTPCNGREPSPGVTHNEIENGLGDADDADDAFIRPNVKLIKNGRS